MESETQNLALSLRNSLQIELIKLPTKAKKMTMREFCSPDAHVITSTVKRDIKKFTRNLTETPSAFKRNYNEPKHTTLPFDTQLEDMKKMNVSGMSSEARKQAKTQLLALQAQMSEIMSSLQSPIAKKG